MQSSLEDKWFKILEARHYGDGVDFTPADLDGMVRNFKSGEDEIPVGVGRNSSQAAKLATVQDLRRNGNDLEAKLSRVSPQLEAFHSEADRFPKAAVAVKKSDAGPSIQRVGFLREDGTWPRAEKSTPSVDYRGNDEVIFAEDSPASRSVGRLKSRGLWRPVFDKYCFPEIFQSLQSSDVAIQFEEGGQLRSAPALAVFARFVESIVPLVDAGAGDADLHSTATKLQRENGISYSEALTIADRRRTEALRDLRFSEPNGSAEMRGAALDRETRRVAEVRGIPYGEALSEVAKDRPELTTQ